jgi:hypothetical protein
MGMNTKLGFVTKVMGLSAVGALLIKLGGPLLPVTGTSTVALGIVLSPSLILAGILGWRALKVSP